MLQFNNYVKKCVTLTVSHSDYYHSKCCHGLTHKNFPLATGMYELLLDLIASITVLT